MNFPGKSPSTSWPALGLLLLFGSVPVIAQPATPAAPAAAPAPVVIWSISDTKTVPVTAPIDLFNGRNLDGWAYIAAGQTAAIADVCEVKDGVIVVKGVPGKATGFVMLPQVRENYRLHVEWRWTAAVTANTNGGILLNITPGVLQQGLWPISLQLQLKSQRVGDMISMSTAATAEAAPGATANRQKDASEKPAGEWNSADITVRGDTIECTINGVLQNKLSKVVPSAGRIGFQLEGHPFELRAIRLSPLTP